MNKLIREMRRREVFRTAGLYIGISWILIEVASVLLPAFGAPDWLVRGAIIVAVVGFPIMLVLAWFFDADEQGVHLQADPTETVVESLGIRKTDYAIIGVLVLALVVSVTLNVRKQAPAGVESAPEPVSVLLADFDIASGDPAFAGILELALVVGLEAAPNLDAFEPATAKSAGLDTMNADAALDYAQRAGFDLVLTGEARQVDGGYEITLEGKNSENGEVVFAVEETADSRDAVLEAVAELTTRARKKLDVARPHKQEGASKESFTAASLDAAHAYAKGRRLEAAGKLEEATIQYKEATTLDPTLAYAWVDLALAGFALGQTDSAAGYWTQALALMNTMTEREQLRAKARYAAATGANAEAVADVWEDLLELYPADVAARRAYADASFRELEFSKAEREARTILARYPEDYPGRAAVALYAMYAGDWETARDEAETAVAADSDYGTAYLPLAMASLAAGLVDDARIAYDGMASATRPGHAASTAILGLADIELFVGRFDAAEARLTTSIEVDLGNGDARSAARKYIALGELYAEQARFEDATAAVAQALQFDDSDAVTVIAAMIYLEAGDIDSARAIADRLLDNPGDHSRAYGHMLRGLILKREGEATDAIFALREAIGIADLWLIRLHIGKAYLEAGNYPVALDELSAVTQRLGEATSVFLDDVPTYRMTAQVPYWHGRVQEALGIRPAARASYEEFLVLRPEGSSLATDAAERVAGLN